MIKTTQMLLDDLKSYANPKTKLARMVKRGACFPIIKGLYETERHVPGHLLAGSICGPSYISFSYALGMFGMIPEAVHTITSATFEKKKKKRYITPYGTFLYQDIPSAAFPHGIELRQEGEYFYRMACPEKALCDQLYTLPPAANMKEFAALLFEFLRIEPTEMQMLDAKKAEYISSLYRSTNTRRLAKFLRRLSS